MSVPNRSRVLSISDRSLREPCPGPDHSQTHVDSGDVTRSLTTYVELDETTDINSAPLQFVSKVGAYDVVR